MTQNNNTSNEYSNSGIGCLLSIMVLGFLATLIYSVIANSEFGVTLSIIVFLIYILLVKYYLENYKNLIKLKRNTNININPIDTKKLINEYTHLNYCGVITNSEFEIAKNKFLNLHNNNNQVYQKEKLKLGLGFWIFWFSSLIFSILMYVVEIGFIVFLIFSFIILLIIFINKANPRLKAIKEYDNKLRNSMLENEFCKLSELEKVLVLRNYSEMNYNGTISNSEFIEVKKKILDS